SVKNGRITLPDGMTYRLLVLPESETMTPRLLRKVTELVKAGATVIGPRPSKSPSLSNYPACDAEVAQVAEQLWAKCDGNTILEHRLGKGKVIWGKSPEQALPDVGIAPDFDSRDPAGHAALRFIHRHLANTEIYFVINASTQPQQSLCTFRVKDRR